MITRWLILAVSLFGLTACYASDEVVSPPIVVVDEAPSEPTRDPTCEDDPDDGIGGTGCSQEDM
ncbi:MAG: hypothetical protein AAF393_10730 [Pseudomonadota bacterium]